MNHVVAESGCWLWLGKMFPNGYGYGYFGHGQEYAHRHAYEEAVGPVPDGLELDHLCRNRLCVNPKHLEPVTHAVNARRGAVAKLNWEQVREIRGSKESGVALARKFGVTQPTISRVRHGQCWREEPA